MIVRNPTGSQITYSFTTLTLAAGATAEIDNSFLENVGFQEEQEAGNISIVKYEKDMVTNTVTISIGESLNALTNSQKGAAVGANEPSILNPFGTIKDLEYNDIKLYRKEENILGMFGVQTKKIMIGSSIITVSSEVTINTQTDYTINSAGNLTTDTPTVSSTLYVYANKTPSIRLSTVAPTNMYLNSNRNWKYVGKVYLNSNGCMDTLLSVFNEYHSHTAYVLDGLTETYVPETTDEEEIHSVDCLFETDNTLLVSGIIPVASSTASDVIEVHINHVNVGSLKVEEVSTNYMVSVNYPYRSLANEKKTISIGVKCSSTDCYIEMDKITLLFSILK